MKTDVQTRRDFVRSCVRAGIAGSLAASGAFLVARNKICLRGGACRSCGLYARCELPQKEKPR